MAVTCNPFFASFSERIDSIKFLMLDDMDRISGKRLILKILKNLIL